MFSYGTISVYIHVNLSDETAYNTKSFSTRYV
jgi:hypothetical protein